MKDRLQLQRFCRIPPLIPYHVITLMGMIFIEGQFSAKTTFFSQESHISNVFIYKIFARSDLVLNKKANKWSWRKYMTKPSCCRLIINDHLRKSSTFPGRNSQQKLFTKNCMFNFSYNKNYFEIYKKKQNINKQTNKNTVFYEKGSVVTKKKEFAIKEAHYSVFN